MIFYLTVVLAGVIATSFIFHLAFERPFLRRRDTTAASSMTLQPAVP